MIGYFWKWRNFIEGWFSETFSATVIWILWGENGALIRVTGFRLFHGVHPRQIFDKALSIDGYLIDLTIFSGSYVVFWFLIQGKLGIALRLWGNMLYMKICIVKFIDERVDILRNVVDLRVDLYRIDIAMVVMWILLKLLSLISLLNHLAVSHQIHSLNII